DDRRDRSPYHRLIDELEGELLREYVQDADVLEVGCGTGRLLDVARGPAQNVAGVDISRKMLASAVQRGHRAFQASAEHLPFPDETFDVAFSFKVLSHVPDLGRALSEMTRVVRPGGWVIFDLYNRMSFRALAKRLGRPGRIAGSVDEGRVFTRMYEPTREIPSLLPSSLEPVRARGVRIWTPAALFLKIPGLGLLLASLERASCDGPLCRFGGFYITVARKREGQ
ncbi:MAG: class I SAM-dependent methyltransferase, partial [Nitrospinota bacterium]|nr:class I SAM-dependent methyltransferase [Nitrospinota bacterium]